MIKARVLTETGKKNKTKHWDKQENIIVHGEPKRQIERGKQ